MCVCWLHHSWYRSQRSDAYSQSPPSVDYVKLISYGPLNGLSFDVLWFTEIYLFDSARSSRENRDSAVIKAELWIRRVPLCISPWQICWDFCLSVFGLADSLSSQSEGTDSSPSQSNRSKTLEKNRKGECEREGQNEIQGKDETEDGDGERVRHEPCEREIDYFRAWHELAPISNPSVTPFRCHELKTLCAL